MRVRPLFLALILSSAATTAHADPLRVTAGHVFLDPMTFALINLPSPRGRLPRTT